MPAVGRRALGYVSVCAGANGTAQAELTRQAETIHCACEARGLELVAVVRDLETPPRADAERPGLRHALEQISAGDASCLVVDGLDRLGASAAAVGTLAGWFDADGRRLVAADLGLDTETPTGKVALRALAAAGQLDTRKLAERTRRGLAAARANGAPAGRPSVADRPGLCERIAQMRADGKSLQAIADELNAQRVPTLRGGAHWRPSSVQAATGYKRPGRVRRLENPPVPGRLPRNDWLSGYATLRLRKPVEKWRSSVLAGKLRHVCTVSEPRASEGSVQIIGGRMREDTQNVGRAAFLGRAALVAGSAAGASLLLGPRLGERAEAQGAAEKRALNLALTVEYAEAEFYAEAVDRGKLKGELRAFPEQVSGQEDEHLAFIKSALGSSAGPKPSSTSATRSPTQTPSRTGPPPSRI